MTTTQKIDLQEFCSKQASRYTLHKPWFRNGFTWATDGRICIRVPGEHAPPLGDDERAPDAESLPWDQSKYAEIGLEIPEIPEAPSCECEDCHGSGEVRCDLDHKHKCEDCDGTGRIVEVLRIEVAPGYGYADRYLRRLKGIGAVLHLPIKSNAACRFVAGEAEGLLMPLNK